MMTEEAKIFREEAFELLDEIEGTLLELRDTPESRALMDKLFRDLHTIKGSGAMFGFDKVAEFTHKLEDTIDTLRKEYGSFSDSLIDIFLRGRDHIIQLIEANNQTDTLLEEESKAILGQISDYVSGGEKPGMVQEKPIFPTKLKMLIVEDEFSSRFILQDFLSSFGAPHVAVDGYEAVLATKRALIEKRPYDLICLDIKMPGIDGIKVSEEIKRLEKELDAPRPTKIIMVSVINDPKKISELLDGKHCDLYLVKPVSIKKLSEFINSNFAFQANLKELPPTLC